MMLLTIGLAIVLSLVSPAVQTPLFYRGSSCDVSGDSAKFDCFPDPNPTQQACTQRGCCWHENLDAEEGVPLCYFPTDFPTYQVTNATRNGTVTTLSLYNPATIFRPSMIHNLTAEARVYSNGIQRIRIYDPLNSRYEVPVPLFDGESPQYSKVKPPSPTVLSDGQFAFHSSDGNWLLSTVKGAPLIFTDQFIQISVQIFGSQVYGIGEQVAPFMKNVTNWQRYSLFARDHGPSVNTNLYGTFPFALVLREDGTAYGILFLNSNAQDIDITPYPAFTFRTIGGIIDLLLFEGPSPADVISQYHSVIAKPAMPPYWALGFHLCRWGYANDSQLFEVINRTISGGFPYDVQWVDIDHMHSFLDWTFDSQRFSNLPKIVDYLHSIEMRFVNIIDPGINNRQPSGSYPPYDDGHASDVFIKTNDGKELVGEVWPGPTVFPDFTHPNSSDYFYRQAATFRQNIEFDGLWLDMNEPSNFIKGSSVGCTNNSLDNPPYVPALDGRDLALGTICPSAKQYLSTHYNLHSLYGYFETKAANQALRKLDSTRRPFLLSRSTFVGSQEFTAHWTGDISSSWDDLNYSIGQIMNFNLFGIPFTGADICGFSGDTTEEMCVRWMQLGAFYPFMRNHNAIGSTPQDPGAFSQQAQSYIRIVLYRRYEMLPYIYTRLYRAYVDGVMVSQPLFIAFPDDPVTYPIADQFLFGDALMVSPVTKAGATSRQVYFPNATWYSIDGDPVQYRGNWASEPAPLSTIPLHLRGGYIVPCQAPQVTTESSRRQGFFLLAALDEYTQSAEGELFIDDGVSQSTVESKQYSIITFKVAPGLFVSDPNPVGYKPRKYSTELQAVNVLGVSKAPTQVLLNGSPVEFKYSPQKHLAIGPFSTDLLTAFKITWS